MENSAQDLYAAGGRIPAQLAAQEAIEKDEATESFITQISYGEPFTYCIGDGAGMDTICG